MPHSQCARGVLHFPRGDEEGEVPAPEGGQQLLVPLEDAPTCCPQQFSYGESLISKNTGSGFPKCTKLCFKGPRYLLHCLLYSSKNLLEPGSNFLTSQRENRPRGILRFASRGSSPKPARGCSLPAKKHRKVAARRNTVGSHPEPTYYCY